MVPFRFLASTLAAALLCAMPGTPFAAELATMVVRPVAVPARGSHEAVVEAVRQTTLASQVAGAVTVLDVRAGDRVRSGQVLLRIDSRSADQQVLASEAQVQSARAALAVATRDLERQRQLFQQNYISQAALDRAEADFKVSQAQSAAQRAQAGAVHTESGYFVVRAPFAGVVADVPINLGDMALPGKPLLTLYDPAALRVTASVPSSQLAIATRADAVRIELPGLPQEQQWPQPGPVQVLPAVDPATHTGQVRVGLPAGLRDVAPGTYARLWLAGSAAATNAAATPLRIPSTAVVRRTELTACYVLAGNGQPTLRQIRLGETEGELVAVLSGLRSGDKVVLHPELIDAAR